MHAVLRQLPLMSGRIVDDTRHEKVLSYMRLFLASPGAIARLGEWDAVRVLGDCLQQSSDHRVSAVAVRFLGDCIAVPEAGRSVWRCLAGEQRDGAILRWIVENADSQHALLRFSCLYFVRMAAVGGCVEEGTQGGDPSTLLERLDYRRYVMRRLLDSGSYFVVEEACSLLGVLVYRHGRLDPVLCELVRALVDRPFAQQSTGRKLAVLSAVSALYCGTAGRRPVHCLGLRVLPLDRLALYLVDSDRLIRDRALDVLENTLRLTGDPGCGPAVGRVLAALAGGHADGAGVGTRVRAVTALRIMAAVVKEVPSNSRLVGADPIRGSPSVFTGIAISLLCIAHGLETEASAKPQSPDDELQLFLCSLIDPSASSSRPGAAADSAAALQAGADVLSEEIGGRRLRVRKRKVDYAMTHRGEEGPARKALRSPEGHHRNADGDYVMGEAPESDDDDGDTMSDTSFGMPLRPAATAVLDPLVKVIQSELRQVIEMHCERLIQCYNRSDDPSPNQQQKQYLQSRMNATIAERFISASRLVPEVPAAQPLLPPSYADPELFFPIPANVRLYSRQTQTPPQHTSTPCWACAAPRHHRDYCPRITSPAFISCIRSIKDIPGFWFSPLYHRFIHWYTYQYMWFILGDPRGAEVNERNRSTNPEYCTNVSIYVHELRSLRAAAPAAPASSAASRPLTPTSSAGPYADTRKRSPYVVVLPRNTRWMQKTHGRMLARVDPAAASKFFDHMATTDTRYAYFKADAQKKKKKKRKKEQNSTGADDGKDAFSDIAALRKAVKDLGHLRTNSVREMRARIDGWMARPTSDGLAKASQLLLGTRFIVDRAARTRSTLVGKFVIRMSLSVARQEAERGLAELLGSQKPALSPAGFENIVKSRQLLLLLLRIKTMCTRHAAGGDGGDPSNGGAGAGAGAVRYADRMRPVVALLDVLRQTLVERMDTAKGLASRTGGIRASITALHELVVAERNHLAGNPTGGAAGLFSSSSFRSKYRGMFMAEIKKLYSRLKDVTLSGPDTHVLNTPDTDTVNMAAATAFAACASACPVRAIATSIFAVAAPASA
ncbi:hypothetical protein GGI11_003864 [Coemansia sp. RSA 2049]|nr:hypothetical protein GGI11_003864 [Coemansia sp. RSA 2049]